MPHISIIAEVGSIPNTSGIRIERPATGPMPGSAPISVPTITPSVTTRRLNGVNAIAKPVPRLVTKSIQDSAWPISGKACDSVEARITRAPLEKATVDLTSLARSVCAELEQRDPSRRVDARIADDLAAHGDASLLRIALENLLGNAWKFTAKRPAARIEVFAEQVDGETVYRVRDDGDGFDMAHAGKLFGPFQRLHRAEEFDGTGIGLATVKRIVVRHGGRIWADAAPGKGATFSFTLGGRG